MARLTAKGTTCPQALRRTLTLCRRDFQEHYDAWQEAYPQFKEHLGDRERGRLKLLGRTLWRFDLRFRWAVGVTALEFDDRIVTKATTGPTRQGYFLLMRLVDLWFSLDLAFDMYRALLVPARVKHPSVLTAVRHDAAKRLRPLRAAEQAAAQTLKPRMKDAEKRARFVRYLVDLADEAHDTTAGRWTGEAAEAVAQRKRVEAHGWLAVAQTLRNRYVHGGETASTKGFPAQEKVPVLRLLTGVAQVAALALATAGAEELLRQLRRQVGIRR
jgi:hypothetical protein